MIHPAFWNFSAVSFMSAVQNADFLLNGIA